MVTTLRCLAAETREAGSRAFGKATEPVWFLPAAKREGEKGKATHKQEAVLHLLNPSPAHTMPDSYTRGSWASSNAANTL